ncbi:hypothetical protein SAMN05444337_0238 [Flavobacterium haoranii]|uniref:Uncharacterized protein n=1 Tax=Flavobacterium haoranii TaxID=683124 RepID=A0A1M6BZ77_9FLAO|nr:hypothetical protein SAMN05444337_0238 [Flavobacterium haoranii]
MSIAPCVMGGCSLFVQYSLTSVAKPQFDSLITLRVTTGLCFQHTAPLCSASSLRSFLSAYCVAGLLTLPQHRHHAPQSFQKAIYILYVLTLFSCLAVLRGVRLLYKTSLFKTKKSKKRKQRFVPGIQKSKFKPFGFLLKILLF